MSKIIYMKWLFKVLVSSTLAFLTLCVFSFFYSNPPIRITNQNGMTDYIWEMDSFYSQATEGFSFGKTDIYGHMNLPGATESDTWNILIMGSSHMEAMNVQRKQSTASLLGNAIDNLKVYNIGTSGHTLLKNMQNLPNVLQQQSPEYIIIETGTVEFSDSQILQTLANELPHIPSYGTGINYYLQKLTYLRLLRHQLEKSFANHQDSSLPELNNHSLLVELLTKINNEAIKRNVKLIIFYHPTLQLNDDGSVTPDTNADSLLDFSAACDDAVITFLDMTQPFLDEYNTSYILPHGFVNTNLGTGHLNADGHRIIAGELAKLIREMEGDE